MEERDTFSVRLERGKRKELDRLAASMERPRSYVVKQAIDQYLEYHAWKSERVLDGQVAARRGNIVSHDDLFKKLRRRYRGSKPG